MIKHFDHVTIVVRDVEAAKQFFGLLGFKEDKSVVIAGPQFSTYMGVEGVEAEHITLVLANVSPRTEVQLLKYRHPDPLPDPAIGNLTKLGFNHVCFAVDNVEAEVARLKAKGVNSGTRSWTSMTESWSFFPDRKASPWNWRNGMEATGSSEAGGAPDSGYKADV